MTTLPYPNPEVVAAPVTRISHLSLKTPRLEAMVRHYTIILGLTHVATVGDTVHLACSDGTPALELSPGDAPSLDHLAFDLNAGADLDDTARELEKAGMSPKPWEGVTPADTESLQLTDPDGAVLQIMSRKRLYTVTEQPHQGIGVKPFKLGHVASRVEKLAEVIHFYQAGFGFRFSDSIGDDFVFLRCNADHHAVNFLRNGPPRHVHHFAFELQDWNHVKLAADELWSYGVGLLWGPGRHGAGHNLYTYHYDPDGNIVELFAELDRMSDEGAGVFDWRPWHGGPQTPRRWDPADPANAGWGIHPPDKFLF